MAIDLKPIFDAARAADAAVQTVLADMNTAFALGTDEGRQTAMALRPKLQDARAAAESANALYAEMRDAAQASSGAAQKFVPVHDAETAAAKGKSMSFDAFQALDARARMDFIRSGGNVTE